MSISAVHGDKSVEGGDKPVLAEVVCEVIPLQVVEEGPIWVFVNARNFSAFICALGSENFFGGVSDNFSALSAIFGVVSDVVVALDVEVEVSFPLNHLFVGAFVLFQPFCVLDIFLDIAAAAPGNQIHQIGAYYNGDCGSNAEERVQTHQSHHKTSDENEIEDDNCQM